MVRYKNEIVLKTLGKRLKAERLKAELEIEDLAALTGFSYNTIYNIENGFETYLSYFIEVCFSLGVHPKEIMDIELDLSPRFSLPASRLEKSRLTNRINTLIESSYFKIERSASDVTEKLRNDHNLDFKSKNVSVILVRFVKSNVLNISKVGNRNFYSTK
ncbi:helix-turn-helix domain-containing protein [Flavobacterium pectinovorum]|uniref:XRE family transcriptional regulator n=1 Tax=Flavobacterium pectinovorum TaxID=29533 RepID=A0A502E0K3_9FLAO|nr:helix-turn-helix transcriptional regulator [Flavobacterium pectinovorum]TPG31318.1 XRE family transcriptional regulator [Flavobacterium pectinovorum]